ncbi:MAG: hypothetical protein AB1801_03080 [Chloroflexota bacterium]
MAIPRRLISRTISELNSALDQPILTTNDMASIIARIRVLIEGNRLQNEYPFLNLYCNWTLHTELSQSLVYLKMLEDLTDLFIQQMELEKQYGTSDLNFIHLGVRKILGIPSLRNEFVNLCKRFNLPDVAFSDPVNWKGVFGLILDNLIDRPIQFPEDGKMRKNKKIQAIYDAIESKTKNYPKLAVCKFWFTVRDDPNPNTVYWCVETTFPVSFTGRFPWKTDD